MTRIALSELNKLANSVGLFITSYNPGDGARYKVSRNDADYFALSGGDILFRANTLHSVFSFVTGYFAGMGSRT